MMPASFRPFATLLAFLLAAASASPRVPETPSALVPGPDASHVGGIDGSVITVVGGRTQAFTVDTPANAGLVSTAPDVPTLLRQFTFADGTRPNLRLLDVTGAPRTEGTVVSGDRLVVADAGGRETASYTLNVRPLAVVGRLVLERGELTAGLARDLQLDFTAGQRSPGATVRIVVPRGIAVTPDNTTVNVIGRGEVSLRDLPAQSIGRAGSAYSYSRVGDVEIVPKTDGSTLLVFRQLDLRPANGPDLRLVFRGVRLNEPGRYVFRADYDTAAPDALTSPGLAPETATLSVVRTLADFDRVPPRGRPHRESPATYTSVAFRWTPKDDDAPLHLLHSLDDGRTWTQLPPSIDPRSGSVTISGLAPDRLHLFRLQVASGPHGGPSNLARFYSGKHDVKRFGVSGLGRDDDTDRINAAIAHLAELGGGTLLFSEGDYRVRTVHLRSNVWLHVDKGATIYALKGADAPETTWFSDRRYRSGLSPTDTGPYEDPENYLTKQDVGHSFFRNTMFFGERIDNVKILGNGRITGDGNLVTGDRVMNNPPDNRADKMFTFKLCTDIEIGGFPRDEDLWYDPERDEPYYIGANGEKRFEHDTMLHLDRGGHFVLLATGTDGIHVHNTYFGLHSTANARDLYDFMACNDVTVTNIYSRVSSDDIVKLGSDCSLGFTRPVRGYRVRNVIGDTNCNLFQIGSETADDIVDVHVDNIFVTGANKAGFSISTNDGGHVRDIHLNSGLTGPLHSRSKMLRTRSPFFISISNRARVLGATVRRYQFESHGRNHDELLATNIDIGVVENVFINHIDVTEMYAGSSFRGGRWRDYNGTQNKAAPIVAGYRLPDPDTVVGGLDFRLPNGEHTGRITNIAFRDVHFLAKGGNPPSDAQNRPAELGVGQYNVSNLGVLPAYGLWARHVRDLSLTDCTFNYEERDGTPALHLENVAGARLSGLRLVRARTQPTAIAMPGSSDIVIEDTVCFDDAWGENPTPFPQLRLPADTSQ